MGLSDDQIKAISIGWRANMEAVHKALLKHEAFAWDLFPNQHNAGCGAGPEITKANCHAMLSRECDDTSSLYRTQALYYGLTRGNLSAPTVGARLPDLAQDLVRTRNHYYISLVNDATLFSLLFLTTVVS